MAKKKKESGFPAQTEQRRYHVEGVDTCFTNAIPRDTSYDLIPCPTRTRVAFGTYAYDEQEFKVVKKGNCP